MSHIDKRQKIASGFSCFLALSCASVPDGKYVHVRIVGIAKLNEQTNKRNPFFLQYFSDRMKNGQALMMEDMGQIIGMPSSDKYESSCEKVATAISQYSSAPTIDLVDYFRRILFCYLTANADMHLKNWSLLENEMQLGTFILSPCYDLLNTRLPIPDEGLDIGLPIGGKGRNLQKSYFIDFSKRLAIPAQLVEKSFQDVHLWAEIARSFIPKTLLAPESKTKYLEIIKTRANGLR